VVHVVGVARVAVGQKFWTVHVVGAVSVGPGQKLPGDSSHHDTEECQHAMITLQDAKSTPCTGNLKLLHRVLLLPVWPPPHKLFRAGGGGGGDSDA
jgi:hypothetical protein